MDRVRITEETLDVAACQAAVTRAGAGGQVLFVGTVRNRTADRAVRYLEFEAYTPMALREMQKIVDTAVARWGLHGMVMHHRVGRVLVGEAAVVIACAAPHRAEAFAACQYAIDTLKETVPIWKKEVFIDGEIWVSAHP